MAMALGATTSWPPVMSCVGNPAAVHDLGEDPAAFSVNCVGDLLPAGDLLRGDETGLTRVGPSGGAGVDALADDQSQGRALPVVLHNQRARDTVLAGAETGQRRHYQAVGQFKLAESQGGKQHAQFLSNELVHRAQLRGACNYSI